MERARGLRADQPDVPRVTHGGVGEFAGRLVGDEFKRYAQAIRNRARHVGCDALGITVRALARDEQEIEHIDPGAQCAFWRQLLNDFILHDGLSPVLS